MSSNHHIPDITPATLATSISSEIHDEISRDVAENARTLRNGGEGATGTEGGMDLGDSLFDDMFEPMVDGAGKATLLEPDDEAAMVVSSEHRSEQPLSEPLSEPLLVDSADRYVMFPIQDNAVWDMYKKQVDCFWRVEEVDLSKDMAHWRSLSDDEQRFIRSIIAFFASSDGIVLENLAVRFMSDVQLAEARAFYGFQIAMENIHSEMYSLLIDTYIQDAEEKTRLFRSIDNFPCIKRKADWAIRWIQDERSDFATRLLAFACIEGIFFSGAFCSIYWLKRRGLMPGLTFSNELISRDEALHTEFAVLLYSRLNAHLSETSVHAIVRDAVVIEKDFICEALPCRLIGMNATMMSRYIEFVADRLVVQLGYEKIYGTANPFDFMEMISIEGKTNFFEKRTGEYALADKSKTDDIFDMDGEF
jgi:ribonucleoside-diphosphate reductase subunit M2